MMVSLHRLAPPLVEDITHSAPMEDKHCVFLFPSEDPSSMIVHAWLKVS